MGSSYPEEAQQHHFACKKCQTCHLKKTHKFGIEVPKTVEEALALDAKNSNTYWADDIAKEMKNVKIA